MKALKVAALVLLIGLILAAFAAPIGVVPGFLIGGTPMEVPDSWGETRPIHEIELQIGEGPIGRTVTIWMVQLDGDLYVIGDADSAWTRGIGTGGSVRMRMEDRLYDLTATPVAMGQADVIAAWLKKYEPDYPEIVAGAAAEERARTAAVFRLTARS